MGDTTSITLTDEWQYVIDLVLAARLAEAQTDLVATSAADIHWIADKDNGGGRIFRTTDPTSPAEGEPLLAEEVWHDSGFPGTQKSLLGWYVKSDPTGQKLDIILQY